MNRAGWWRWVRVASAWALLALLAGLWLPGCGDDEEAGEKKTPPTPVPEAQVEIIRPIKLTDHARIPENDPAFDHADATKDAVVIFFKSKPKMSIDVGNVIAGTGKTPYLRWVEEVVSRTDTRLEVKTKSAYITDLIADGAFSAVLTPDGTTWQAHVDPEVSGQQYALSSPLDMFSYSPIKVVSCQPAAGPPVVFKPVLIPDIKTEVMVDIVWTWPEGAALAKARFAVAGSVTLGAEVDVPATAGVNCTSDLIKELREATKDSKFLRLAKPITYVIPSVPPIPIEFTLFIDPIFTASLEAKVDASMTVSATGTATVTAGYELKDGKWQPIWSKSVNGYAGLKFGEKAGQVSATGTFSAGVRGGALLYDTAGPTLGITGTLTDTITADIPACSWNQQLSLGLDAQLSLLVQVPVVARELWNLPFEPLTLAKTNIGSPSKGSLPLCCSPDAAGCTDAGDADADDAADTDAADASLDADDASDTGLDAALDASSDGASPCQLLPRACVATNGTCTTGFDCCSGICSASKCQAATSCLQIKTATPSAVSADYELAGSPPYRVWCDMTSYGGGWTLILKTGGKPTTTTFAYDSPYWTGTGLVNPTDFAPNGPNCNATESKLASFNDVIGQDLRMQFVVPSGIDSVFPINTATALTTFKGPQNMLLGSTVQACNGPILQNAPGYNAAVMNFGQGEQFFGINGQSGATKGIRIGFGSESKGYDPWSPLIGFGPKDSFTYSIMLFDQGSCGTCGCYGSGVEEAWPSGNLWIR